MSYMLPLKISYAVFRGFLPEMYKLVGTQRRLLLPGNDTIPSFWKAMGKPQFLIDNALNTFLDHKPFVPMSELTEQVAKEKGNKYYDCLLYYGFLVGFPIFEILKTQKDNKKKNEILEAKLKEIDEDMEKLLEKRKKRKH